MLCDSQWILSQSAQMRCQVGQVSIEVRSARLRRRPWRQSTRKGVGVVWTCRTFKERATSWRSYKLELCNLKHSKAAKRGASVLFISSVSSSWIRVESQDHGLLVNLSCHLSLQNFMDSSSRDWNMRQHAYVSSKSWGNHQNWSETIWLVSVLLASYTLKVSSGLAFQKFSNATHKTVTINPHQSTSIHVNQISIHQMLVLIFPCLRTCREPWNWRPRMSVSAILSIAANANKVSCVGLTVRGWKYSAGHFVVQIKSNKCACEHTKCLQMLL